MTVCRKPVLSGGFFTAVILLFFLTGCGDTYPANPYRPSSDTGETLPLWQDVLAGDSNYPENVYLTENVEFNPGLVGVSRQNTNSVYYGTDGKPVDSTKNGACGPPEGSAALYSSKADMTVLGSGGSAVWRFDPKWVIVNGIGDDFITFSNHNVLFGEPDGSWNELARVFVSEDNVNWYKCSTENFDENLNPGTANGAYLWANVSGLHGNNHSWANFREDVAAEELNTSTGKYEAVTNGSGVPVMLSKYFEPDDSYLGGDRFNLGDFVHSVTGAAWPAGGKMKYLKLVDAPDALDGQDWNPDWMTGARIMSAMGVNVEPAN
jgi:hypothetical protein